MTAKDANYSRGRTSKVNQVDNLIKEGKDREVQLLLYNHLMARPLQPADPMLEWGDIVHNYFADEFERELQRFRGRPKHRQRRFLSWATFLTYKMSRRPERHRENETHSTVGRMDYNAYSDAALEMVDIGDFMETVKTVPKYVLSLVIEGRNLTDAYNLASTHFGLSRSTVKRRFREFRGYSRRKLEI